MKRILILAALLAGCSEPLNGRPSRLGLIVYTDPQTECQYVTGGEGITPRIAADGKTHMGCKAVPMSTEAPK